MDFSNDDAIVERLFEILPRLDDTIIEADRAALTMNVRAMDGRVVTLQFDARLCGATVRQIDEAGDLKWLDSGPADRRWFSLLVTHISESINAFGRDHASRYVQVPGGFDPVPALPDQAH
ncbi:hypothetical protein [Agromyces soli]|uniref:Uncharacterized protein n=1 Tax=Agromyces soli TaxID=659012 RepID=A0ABY4ATW0_9MICO|nr:hypothetical protein [Agromyces soli]UOE26607.1 hypothetical protein MTP13_02165 [Agromyces soli]